MKTYNFELLHGHEIWEGYVIAESEEEAEKKILNEEKSMQQPLYCSYPDYLKTNCPIDYNYYKCSSKEYDMSCKSCMHYNPLRIINNIIFGHLDIDSLGIPVNVLLEDLKVQMRSEKI